MKRIVDLRNFWNTKERRKLFPPLFSFNYIEMPKLLITPKYVTEILILNIQIPVPS